MTDFVVFRLADDLAAEGWMARFDGFWIDKKTYVPDGVPINTIKFSTGGAPSCVARPTGEFEFNESRQVAEVWRIERVSE